MYYFVIDEMRWDETDLAGKDETYCRSLNGWLKREEGSIYINYEEKERCVLFDCELGIYGESNNL